MIPLLFLVLFAEGVLAFLLVVKVGPLRELVVKGLDQVKMGKGPATVKTIAGSLEDPFTGGFSHGVLSISWILNRSCASLHAEINGDKRYHWSFQRGN
ncbi:hypothetical protein Vadar_021210 [Vaccinium darrowii]|uniref:Uncharacterized protein n=1 Tax=Vaccinium darrowii TaxID=229202 RepID=A0ACB7XBG5_9ERIC|nr:hypothetical protein Vadar_021210 [Vaccinium darrowii]